MPELLLALAAIALFLLVIYGLVRFVKFAWKRGER